MSNSHNGLRLRKINLTAFISVILTVSLTPVNLHLLFFNSPVLAQTSNDKSQQANTLIRQAAALLGDKQITSARQALQQALSIYQQVNDRQGQSVALVFLGISYEQENNYKTAIDYYEKSWQIVQQLPKKPNAGEIVVKLANAHRLQKNYNQAIQYYQQYLALDQQNQDSQNRIAALGNLGRTYAALNNLPQALDYYQQTLALSRATNNRQSELTALLNLGETYLNLENYAAAIEVSQKGLVIAKELTNSIAVIDFLRYISNAYYFIADYNQAIQYNQQSLEIARIIQDKDSERQTLNSLGNIYYYLRDYDKAINYYEQVLSIARSQSNRRSEGLALGNIGLAYINKGEAAKAIDYLEKDLAVSRIVGDRLNESQTLGYLGSAYLQVKNYSKSVEYYQQALIATREAKYTRGEGITFYNLSIPLMELGKLQEAEKALYSSIEIWESLRERLGENDSYKISFFEQPIQAYQLLQRVLIAQDKTNEALEVSERGRARAFIDLLSSRQSKPSTRGNAPQLPAVAKPTLSLLKQIAKQQNATLVQYSIDSKTTSRLGASATLEQALYIWVVKPTGEITFRITDLRPLREKDKTSLAELVTVSRQSIGVRGRGGIQVTANPNTSKAKNSFRQLHDLLIKPIADLLPNKESEKVIFIPQESLFLVPFPALQNERGKYLIEKHTILTAPSIQVLDLTRKQKLGHQNSRQGEVLIVGNPTMPKVALEPGKPLAQLPALPGAEKEAKEIAPLFKTKAITGSQATKAAILQQISKARIVHLATHGLLDDNQGLGSAIALAPSGKDNGLLTAEEILNLKLNADLVVLSACDTGRGRVTGDGVIGLSRSLISAGVPSVIVSLWAVDDNSTSFLMTEFYKNLQQKQDKATALRQAMLATMKQDKYQNPLHWAAFSLIGEAE
ncbi:CHAT domain-containing protein [Nostoc spongiaeforme FACHB-130]|uniref:CHAT domain-containing protein n=1 Tax=Nostoc spongiaeforme FACHB-130 TaxID=1357510 RepID=A0ABR8FX81_9NOSO|nr:CHAT domain-containing protein [Nostoc spongiaeforme]MBD2594734.1 CHAT domain-containing protein [Nostoc spongiaeforme FACHB-130]